jgi:hypothetical protein
LFSPAIFRLFVSQAFLCFLFISITPLKKPIKRNTIVIAFGAFFITLINALVIVYFGLTEFYVKYYFLTLILPYFILLSYFAIHKGPKVLFGFLTCQVFGNVAIANGLLVSHLLYGVDTPLIDGLIRVATFILLMPLFLKFVKPKFIEMAETLDKGWWTLSFVLILSYSLTYYVGFVPVSLLLRPEYFPHMYILILLSGFIYLIIFRFFLEIQSKFESQRDKQLLSTQVNAIANQSETVSAAQEKISILRHDMRHQLRIISKHLINSNIEEAIHFLEFCQSELTKTTTRVFCDNVAVNATLSYYFDLAEKNSIKFQPMVEVPQTLNINNAELAVVYANGLENAINACLKENEVNECFINLKSRYSKSQIIIDMSNTCSLDVKFNKQGIPVTDKKDHGIGIMSILAFAKKYDSLIEFSHKDNIFNFKLLINL